MVRLDSGASDVDRGPTLLMIVNVAWFFLSHRLPVALAAAKAGMCVHLASDFEDPEEAAAVERHGITFHHVRISRGGVNPMRELHCAYQLRALVRRLRPDVVHCVTAKPVVYGAYAARSAGTPGVVAAISGFGYAYGAGMGRRLLRSILDGAYRRAFAPSNVRVIVQNEEDRKEVVRLCPGAAPRTRLIRGSGVDLRLFRAEPEREGSPVVILPARMLREKGVVEFAQAAAQLRREGVSARFILAGRLDRANRNSLAEPELRELCTRNGVEWIGECRDMPRQLRESHIVCLPTYYREGVPKALLEACAAQRAIVTTDVPGCRDVVTASQNGLLVPPRDVSALAAALRRLLLDSPLRRRMGEAGRARAEREFGIEAVVASHLELYAEIARRV